MTQTKVQKTIAIVLAMFLAFALMSVTMLNNAKAEATNIVGEGFTMEVSAPNLSQIPDKTNWFVASRDSYEKIPDFTVSIKFTNNDGTMSDKKLYDVVKVYSDSELTNPISLPFDYFTNTVLTASEVSFNALVSKVPILEEGKTYYLKLDKALTANGENAGADVVIQFAVPGTKTTYSTTTTTTTTTTKPTTTTRTTARTITTTRTVRTVTTTKVGVRAKAANTGDESNMPLWIALAILAAGGTAIAYVWKEQE